jgi:hypothetical protein
MSGFIGETTTDFLVCLATSHDERARARMAVEIWHPRTIIAGVNCLIQESLDEPFAVAVDV